MTVVTSLRRNAAINMAGRGVSVGVWIAVTPYVLSRLGVERFGVWSLFFTLSGYAATLDLGMGSGVPRFVALCAGRGDGAGAREVMRRSLLVSCAIGLLWAAACATGRDVLVRGFHVPEPWTGEVRACLPVFAGSLLATSWSQTLQAGLVGLQRLDLSNLAFVAGLLTNALVLIVGLSRGLGLMAAAVGALAGSLVAGGVAALLWRGGLRSLGTPGAGTPRTGWRELLGFGTQVQLTNALAIGQAQAGKLLLALLGKLAWVTPYELGFRVANSLWSIPALVQVAVFPAAAHGHAIGGDEKVRELYAWSCRWVFALAGWLMGGLWVTAPALFALWLGPSPREAISVARALSVAFAFAALAGPASIVARGRGWPGLEAAYFGLALAVNVAAAWPLIRLFGATGAAVAAAVAFGVAGIWILVVFHRRIGVSSAAWLGRLAAPRFVPAAVLAAALAALAGRLPADTRAAALVATLSGAVAFTFLYGLLLLPVGDPQAAWGRGRAWLARASGPRAGESAP